MKASAFAVGRSTSPLLFGPAKPLQVKAFPVIELDAFLFQQALLQDVTTIAGGRAGYLALRIYNAMPRNIASRVKLLEHATDKTGVPWQPSQRGDLSIGGHPAFGNTADNGADCRDSFISLGRSRLKQFALERHRRLSSVPVGIRPAWSSWAYRNAGCMERKHRAAIAALCH